MSNAPIRTNQPSYNAIPTDPENPGETSANGRAQVYFSSSWRKLDYRLWLIALLYPQKTKRTKILASVGLGIIAVAAVSVAGVYYWQPPGKDRA